MKNPFKKQQKKQGKPVNINISFNINSKSVANNDLLSHFHAIKSNMNSTEHKDRDKLSASFSKTPKNIHQLKPNKDSAQFIKQNPRIIKSKRNSLDLTGFHNAELYNKAGTISQKASFKRKNSKNNEIKQQQKSHNNSFTKKKSNNEISSNSTHRLSSIALDIIFNDFQNGKLNLSQMKQVIAELVSNQNQTVKVKKKINLQAKQNTMNLMGTKISKNSSSNIGSFDAKRMDKMRKRNCKSQRGDISTRKSNPNSQTQSFMASARQSMMTRNIVNMKNINSSLMIQPQQDVSPPSPRLEQSKTIKRRLAQEIIIKTSNSMVDIKQKLEKERSLFSNSVSEQQDQHLESESSYTYQNAMAIRIQRAWRRFQTEKLIRRMICDIKRSEQQQIIVQTDHASSIKHRKPIVTTAKLDGLTKNNKMDQEQQQSQVLAIRELQKRMVQQVKSSRIDGNNQMNAGFNNNLLKQYLSSCIQNQGGLEHVEYNQQQEQQYSDDQEYQGNQQGSDLLQDSRLNVQQLCRQSYKSGRLNQDQQLLNLGNGSSDLRQNNQQSKLHQMVKVIQLSLQNRNISKDECLKRMLEMIADINDDQQSIARSPKRQEQSEFNQIASFTNKFESKQMPPVANYQFEVLNTSSEIDIEYTDRNFKAENIQSIEQALRNKQTILIKKRDKQIGILNFKHQNGRICEQVYLVEKAKIQKWYKVELVQLKKAKKNLLKGYRQARSIIEKINSNDLSQDLVNQQRQRGMIKCLSDKYILRNNRRQLFTSSRQAQQENSTNQKYQPQTLLKRQKTPKQIQPENEQQYNLQYEEISKQFDQVSQHERQTLGCIDSPSITQAKEIGLFCDSFSDSPNKKLKYLCAQDKDDIFEFIFLDLCLQIYLENNKGSKINKTLEKAISFAKRVTKIPKGIKTSLTNVKQYLQKFGNFVLQAHRYTLKNLQFPMGPTAQQMLKYMHDIPEDQKQVSSVNNQQSAPLVLSGNIFQFFEKLPQNSLKIQKLYDDIDREHNRRILLNSVMHIHNKAIFDCVNESLDQERPYGLWGKPFPWKKAIKTKCQFNQQERQNKFKKGLQKTIENCSYLCGILVDKQQSLFQNVNVSQQYVNHIKEDRLSKMLANDLIENEERWMFYDDEQTQVLIQLSNYVTKELMFEVIDETICLIKNKQSKHEHTMSLRGN